MREYYNRMMGVKPQKKEVAPDALISSRNYLVREEVEVSEMPPEREQPKVGAVAGLATVIDGETVVKLAPGETYDAGNRIVV